MLRLSFLSEDLVSLFRCRRSAPLRFLIDEVLLDDREECSDEPVYAHSRREEIGRECEHHRHSPQHEPIHDLRIRHEFGDRIIDLLLLDNRLPMISPLLLNRQRHFDLQPLEASDEDCKRKSRFPFLHDEIQSEEMSIDALYIEIRERSVEVVVIRRLGDS